ncbi:MAG TPA: septum formation initiator family protein [Sphingobium sp.]
MAQLAKLRFLLGSALAPALATSLLLLFIGYAIIGPSGLLAWGNYTRQLKDRSAELRVVEAKRTELANRVDLVDPRHADPDMVDELLRRKLNVVHPDEVVVPLN